MKKAVTGDMESSIKALTSARAKLQKALDSDKELPDQGLYITPLVSCFDSGGSLNALQEEEIREKTKNANTLIKEKSVTIGVKTIKGSSTEKDET